MGRRWVEVWSWLWHVICVWLVSGMSLFSCRRRRVVHGLILGHSVTKIGLPETGLGIIPGAGGTQRVTRIIGPSRAKDLIFTGRPLTATQALDWGLVNYISEPDATGFDRALTLAETMTRNGNTIPSVVRPRACLTVHFYSSPGIKGCETSNFSFRGSGTGSR